MEPSASERRGAPENTPAVGPDLVIPVLAVALTVYYLVTTADMSWEARSAGIFVGSILLSLCAVQFARAGRALLSGRGQWRFGSLLADTLDNRRRLALVLLAALFIVTLEWVGVSLGLFLLIAASMAVMGVRSPRQLVLVPLVTSATVFVLLIWLLGTRLPHGPLEDVLLALIGKS